MLNRIGQRLYPHLLPFERRRKLAVTAISILGVIFLIGAVILATLSVSGSSIRVDRQQTESPLPMR